MGNKNFLDKNTILAIVFVSIFFVMWNQYMAKKYPNMNKAQNTQETVKEINQNEIDSNSSLLKGAQNISSSSQSPKLGTSTNVINEIAEEFLEIDNDFWTLKVSNHGMAFSDIFLKNFTDRENNKIGFAKKHKFLPTKVLDQNLTFKLSKLSKNEISGVANLDGIVITKIIKCDAAKYSCSVSLSSSSENNKQISFSHNFYLDVKESKTSFLIPSYDRQSSFVLSKGEKEREYFAAGKGLTKNYEQVEIASLNEHYFSLALVDNSVVLPSLDYINNGQLAESIVKHTQLNSSPKFDVNFNTFFGPKSYELLKSSNEKMTSIIDLGFFSWIAKWLLRLLNFFHNIFNNWGLAIIGLTVLVRLILLPINVSAYRSMKKMQTLQKPMKALREKYKENPQELNKAMMVFMKENKMNPVGGCLPMLAQFPIFLALYQVLGSSIELYKAPFALWIQDLSLKDPFFILPIAMGVALFFQQKLTPSTMDPMQKKVMMFMPLLFSLFMVALPSGLTLYIFVSTLFGILQQMIVMKEKAKPLVKAKA